MAFNTLKYIFQRIKKVYIRMHVHLEKVPNHKIKIIIKIRETEIEQ